MRSFPITSRIGNGSMYTRCGKTLRSGRQIGRGPYYENMRSPSAEKLAVSFNELGYEYVEQWNKHVAEGTMTTISFPDGSLLYLDTQLTQADQEYLARAFWDKRWGRYAEIGKMWAAVLVGPPIALFILGWALLWVGRGFKTARPVS
jgi:hypothetical protein